jgi:hypothetical protein
MRYIEDQARKAVEAIRLEKPVLKLKHAYTDTIRVDLNNRPTYDEIEIGAVDSIVANVVRDRVRVVLSIPKKAYVTKIDLDDVNNYVLYAIEKSVLEFLRSRGGFANNRLSKIYKWYKEKVSSSSMRRNEKLAEDIYNIVKFIDTIQTEDQEKTARTLLSLIKDRYEPILGSVGPK